VLLAAPKLRRLLKLSCAGFDAAAGCCCCWGLLKPLAVLPEPCPDRGVFRPEANGEGVGRRAGNGLLLFAAGDGAGFTMAGGDHAGTGLGLLLLLLVVLGADQSRLERSSMIEEKEGERRKYV